MAPAVSRADFTKTITASPGVAVNAVTTWYYASCTESLGLGSYVVNVAPMHGELSFQTLDGPLPGCPAGSPSLPAAAAFYTLTDSTAVSDSFQLYYELNGQVAEVIDITVNPTGTTGGGGTPPPPECSITTKTLAHVVGTKDTRSRIGVGEFVSLTNGGGNATWTVVSGMGMLSQLSADGSGNPTCSTAQASTTVQGTSVCFIAPYEYDVSSVSSTLTADSASCSTGFSTVEPAGVEFYKLDTDPEFGIELKSGWFTEDRYSENLWSASFVIPGDVSFNNIDIVELDANPPHTQGFLHLDPGPSLIGADNSIPAWFTGCDYENQNPGVADRRPIVSDSYWAFQDLQGGHQKSFSFVRTIASLGIHDLTDFTVGLEAPRSDITYAKGQIQSLDPTGTFFFKSPGIPTSLIVPRSFTDNPLKNIWHDHEFRVLSEYFADHSCLATEEGQFVPAKELSPAAKQNAVAAQSSANSSVVSK